MHGLKSFTQLLQAAAQSAFDGGLGDIKLNGDLRHRLVLKEAQENGFSQLRRQLIDVTREQFEVLHGLTQHRRVAVGTAGRRRLQPIHPFLIPRLGSTFLNHRISNHTAPPRFQIPRVPRRSLQGQPPRLLLHLISQIPRRSNRTSQMFHPRAMRK